MKTKIFEIQIDGEKAWVCADTAIEALKTYCFITDQNIYDFENDDDIVEVPPEKWGSMMIVDIDGEKDDNGRYPVLINFAEYMRTEAYTSDIIATTNF